MKNSTATNGVFSFATAINACANRSHDIRVIMADVYDTLQRDLSVDAACLYLLDDGGRLQLSWSAGLSNEFTKEPNAQTLHSASVMARRAMNSGSVTFVVWTDDHPPTSFAGLLAKEGMREPVWVPLAARGRSMGLLTLTRRRTNKPFDNLAIKPLLEFLGRELGMAYAASLSNAELYSKLQDLESRWKYIYDEAPVMYLAVDAEERIVNCNDAIFLRLGHPIESVVGEKISTLLPNYHDKLAEARKQPARPRQRIQFEDLMKDKVGIQREVMVSWQPLLDLAGVEVGAYVFVDDMTERNRLESENLYKSLLVENSPVGMFVRDLDTGSIVYSNEAAWILRGYSREEFFRLSAADLTAPEYHPLLKDVHEQVLRRGGYRGALPQLRKDGLIMEAEITIKLLEYKGRRLAICVVHDMTERNQLHRQLQQSQNLESLGRLAAGISHDFNNMLAGIMGHASMIRSSLSADDQLSQNVEAIQKTAARAAQVVSQLVVFAKGGKPRLQPVDLNAVARDVAGMLSGAGSDDLEIKMILDPDLPLVQADEAQITQCVLNLCVNARQAMPRGGKLTIKTRGTYIDDPLLLGRMGLRGPGLYAGIRVIDTGVGMDEETQQRLFEPFYTTKASTGGSGFGMAITYGIVRGHSGHIDVRSKTGEGSTITITLPAATITEKSNKPQKAASSVEPQGTILLVEDDEGIRDFVRLALTKSGYTILTAPDGDSALEIIRAKQSEIGLIILDMQMPGMTGRETFEKLRAINATVPVLISSGYSSGDQIVDGVTGYLQKPYGVNELAEAVQAAYARPK